MKWMGRILLACVFFAVLLLGGRTLIQGPGGEREVPADAVQPVTAAVIQSQAEPLLPELPEKPALRWERDAATDMIQLPAVLADRNGQPITSRAWSRTVYQSCAPEGIPG